MQTRAFKAPFRFVAVLIVAQACARAKSASIETSRVAPADSAVVVVDSSSLDAVPRADPADLSGRWVTGDANEPQVRNIQFQKDCRYTPAAWLLDQREDSVFAWQAREQYARGVAEPPQPMPAMATGRLRGHNLVLSDGTNRWVLVYDELSGHLRGTLNGHPFWAMRQILLEPRERCIPVP